MSRRQSIFDMARRENMTLRQLAARIEAVVPELRRRGLFRTAYEGATLRENLGLPIPKNPPDVG